MKPLSITMLLALTVACHKQYSISPSYYSAETERQAVVVEHLSMPVYSALVGSTLFTATLLLAPYPDDCFVPGLAVDAYSQCIARWNSQLKGFATLVGGGGSYLFWRYLKNLEPAGLERGRVVYNCDASSVGYDSQSKVSEAEMLSFLDRASCRVVHKHDDYFLDLFPKNLPNY